LATGDLKKEYLQALQAVGGKPPYSWSVVKFQQLAENPTEQPGKPEAQIPDTFGIKAEPDPSGQYMLRGAPTQAGLYALTLRVQDSASVPAEDRTTLLLALSYQEALAITTTALPDAFVGHDYLARLSHNGGAQAEGIQFSVPCVMQVADTLEDYGCAPVDPSQALPPGLSLNAEGQLSGVPTAPAVGPGGKETPVVYSFLVKVIDAHRRQDVRGLSIRVRPDYDKASTGCSSIPLAPSLAALAGGVLLALRGRTRRFPAAGSLGSSRRATGGLWLFALLGLGCGQKNLCVDKNVRCQSPLICDQDDGLCKCGGRGGLVCAEGTECDPTASTCQSTRCTSVRCSDGTSCDVNDGQCKCGGPGGIQCAADQVCQPAAKACVPAVDCRKLACPRNQTCDLATNHCQCGGSACSSEQFCSISAADEKSCIASLCAGVSCAGLTQCDSADGYCKCNGVLCQAGESCACPPGADGGSCEAAALSCQSSSACSSVNCLGGTTCDPADGRCKCGGPGGPVCSSAQICSLRPSPQCQGGQQCLGTDGRPTACPGGTSCDPEDGRCKCGGRGGKDCAAATATQLAEVCVSNALQQVCRQPCDPRSADCPTGTYCYFDPTAATPVAYCAAATDSKAEGSACTHATDCFVANPPKPLNCTGLMAGESGICRSYCDLANGSAGCLQVPRAQDCLQIAGAPVGYGYCLPQ
jgi:hypothetical protein